MIELGKHHYLQVTKLRDIGAFLDAEDYGEILLPNKYVPDNIKAGDDVKVFLYLDSEDRPIATTRTPHACIGQFAFLKTVGITDFGAFLDWGLEKDLFVPKAEQHRPFEMGQSYLVHLYLDEQDERIVASSRINKFLDDDAPHNYQPKQAVDLLIANSTDLGFKAIVNDGHWGLLYRDEVFQRLSFGQSVQGYIKNIREDGRIDLTLNAGQVTRDKHAQRILDYLHSQNGFARVHDKSDPQLVKDLFSMSKAAFKKALGGLYKQRLITIESDGIRLTGQPNKKTAKNNDDSRKAKAKPTTQSIWGKR